MNIVLEYKVTSLDLMIYTFTDQILLVVLIAVYIILGYCLFRASSKRIILIFMIAFPILIVLPTLIKSFSGWHWYGYELYDNKLHIRACPVDEIIDLNNSTVFLTESDEWRPKIRKFGIGMSKIAMGHFKLENGIKAVVFRHKNSEEIVVINASGKYYVIIHPGVDKLYNEIKVRKTDLPPP